MCKKYRSDLFRVLRKICIALLCGVVLSKPVAAGAQSDSGVQVIPVKTVGGRIYVAGRLFFPPGGDSEFISLEISLESPEVIRLEKIMVSRLAVPASLAPGLTMPMLEEKLLAQRPAYDLVLGDVVFKIPGREFLTLESSEKMGDHAQRNMKYSKALEDIGIAGTLGLGFLKKYRVELNLAAGQLKLFPPDLKEPLSGDIVRSFEERDGRMWIPLSFDAGRSGKMLLSSSTAIGRMYDSYIDRDFARALNKPAGDVGPVLLSVRGEPQIDIAKYVALRPGDLSDEKKQADTDAIVLSGINLLRSFKLGIDWRGSKLALSRIASPQYPQDDLAFFRAELSADPEALVQYLERSSHSSRAEEAAGLLFEWRMANTASSVEQIKDAARRVVATVTPPERRQEIAGEGIYGYMLQHPERSDVLLPVLEELLHHSRGASDTRWTYRIHKYIGDLYTQQGKYPEAWRHLLSAAVGLTADLSPALAAETQNALGLLYEKQERWFKAFAAYNKALRFLGGEVDADHVPTESELKIPRIKQHWDMYLLTTAALERVRPRLTAEDLDLLGN